MAAFNIISLLSENKTRKHIISFEYYFCFFLRCLVRICEWNLYNNNMRGAAETREKKYVRMFHVHSPINLLMPCPCSYRTHFICNHCRSRTLNVLCCVCRQILLTKSLMDLRLPLFIWTYGAQRTWKTSSINFQSSYSSSNWKIICTLPLLPHDDDDDGEIRRENSKLKLKWDIMTWRGRGY